MAEERWQDNQILKVSLYVLIGIIALFGLLYLIQPNNLPEGVTPTDYQSGDWVSPVPTSLKGTWVVDGQSCESEDSLMLIFSNGGYRWRKSRTDWGFARGRYRYTHPNAYRVGFQLQRFVQSSDNPDALITVSGNRMTKFNPLGGTSESFQKCPS